MKGLGSGYLPTQYNKNVFCDSVKSSQDDHLFDAMSRALNGEFPYSGKKTFGILTPGYFGETTSSEGLNTFQKLGELDNRMSASFPYVSNGIQVQSDKIGSIMDSVQVPSGTDNLVGLARQLKGCATMGIGISGEILELDNNSSVISSNLIEIGRMAKKVQSIRENEDGNSVGSFGKVIRRILTSSGNKSTPIETYAGMATKMDAKNSSWE